MGYEPGAMDERLGVVTNINSFAAIEGCALTTDEFMNLKDAKMLVDGLIPQSHIVNIAAPPNAGKTTITMHLCEELAKKGKRIWYINSDCPPDAAKAYYNMAAKYGNFTMILPDFKGIPIQDVHALLDRAVESGECMDDVLIVFDTMKKSIDMMGKSGVSKFYKWLRKFPPLGATIILLMHTNKYPDPTTGKLIFEGVGDILNDTDELFYLYAADQDGGGKKVTIEHEKVRAFDLREATFTIHSDWTVTQDEFVTDVRSVNKRKRKQAKDKLIIEDILSTIYKLGKDGEAATQARIKARLKGLHNHKSVDRVIKEQRDEIWKVEPGMGNSHVLTAISHV